MSDLSEAPSAGTPGTASPFTCSWEVGGAQAAWVRIVGEVDLVSAPQLHATLAEALQRAQMVVVDLREVTFMDSTGIHVLLEADSYAKQAGRRLVFIRGSRNLDRLFEITGVYDRLQLVDLGPAAASDQTRPGTPTRTKEGRQISAFAERQPGRRRRRPPR